MVKAFRMASQKRQSINVYRSHDQRCERVQHDA
jgi:hypothetical protein